MYCIIWRGNGEMKVIGPFATPQEAVKYTITSMDKPAGFSAVISLMVKP